MTTPFIVLQLCSWLMGIPLAFLVVAALIRGPWRQFPLVFLYAVAVFVITLVEIPLKVQYFATGDAAVWHRAASIYWVDEIILQVLIFALVIGLIDQAVSAGRRRRLIRAGLIVGVLVFGSTSFLIHYDPLAKYGDLMTQWTSDLNVCSTVLDLGLWAMLIASRRSDRRLLLISGGLGMQFTGEAIGAAIRHLSAPSMAEAVSVAGSGVSGLADLACLYVWWQVFRPAPAHSPSPAAPPQPVGRRP